MKRTHRIAALAIVTAAGLGLAGLSSFSAPQAACTNVHLHEPVLVYDVDRGTTSGPLALHLAVYGDGHAFLAVQGLPPAADVVRTAQLLPADVAALRSDLISVGAPTLCDHPALVAALPRRTVTVFRGTTNAAAHTFSYQLADGAWADAEALVQRLIAAHFPGS